MRTDPGSDAGDLHDDDDGNGEQDLLIVLRLSNRNMGTWQERQDLQALADELEAAVLAAGVGEYDGDELGGGEYTLFFTAPDCDALLAVLRPMLARSPWCRGAHLVRMVDDGRGTLVRQRQPL